MADVRLKLSPPWAIYVSELQKLFGPDPDITIEYNNDKYQVKMFVANEDKAMAIDRLLPDCVNFGNICLAVTVVPPNDETVGDLLDRVLGEDGDFPPVDEGLFNTAFDKNPVYAYTKTVQGLWSNRILYVVFKNKVVQFFADNLNDLHGLISTLYQDIAEDVFNMDTLDGVMLCTDVEEEIEKSIREWP